MKHCEEHKSYFVRERAQPVQQPKEHPRPPAVTVGVRHSTRSQLENRKSTIVIVAASFVDDVLRAAVCHAYLTLMNITTCNHNEMANRSKQSYQSLAFLAELRQIPRLERSARTRDHLKNT